MIHAAIEVFTDEGYVGARMSDIAARAGVAVQTVYFTFHTKGELLQACFDHAVLGPDRLPPEEQTFYAELLAARSGRAALNRFVARQYRNPRPLGRDQGGGRVAGHEPDATEVVDRSERLRREGLAKIVALLADRFGLRDGLDVGTGTDLVLMLSSSSTYLTLRRYGWSEEAYSDWLTDTLARQLLARPGRR